MSEQLLHQILQKLDHIEAEQSSMKSDILGLKETQELMQVQLGETNAIVRAIRDRQDETDAKLVALSMDVHKLHGEVASIKDLQQQQGNIISLLSARSIQQEADLQELKMAK